MSVDKPLDALLVTGVSKVAILDFLNEHIENPNLLDKLMDKVVASDSQTVRRKAAYLPSKFRT